MVNRLFTLIFVLLIGFGYAQKLDAVRFEVSSDLDGEQFHVEPMGVDGLLIFYESNEVSKEDLRKWYFGLFDTNLKQLWLKFVPLNDKIEFITSREVDGQLHMLFKNVSMGRNDYGLYDIVTYDKRKKTFSRISGSIPIKSEVAGFDVIGNTACLALNLKKRETDLVFISLSTGDVNPIHIGIDTPGIIESLYADIENRLFYVSIKQNRDRRYIKEYLLSYTIDGKAKGEVLIGDNEALKYFREYVFVPSSKNELLILGTYNIVTGRTLSFKDIEVGNDVKSAGLFFLKIIDGKQELLQYYDFMNLDNISGAILPDNFRANKVVQDTGSSTKKNTMVSASFNLNKPKVFRANNGVYIFSVEVYQPYYKTETRMDYDFYGRPYPYTYNVFSGYDFYDAIIAGISNDGVLLWSNDFPINDLLTYSTNRISTIFEDESLITLAYVNNGNVVSQTIDGPADIDRSEMKIGTNFPQDRIAQDENNHIVSWYGDYFLIYGYEKVKNRTLDDQSTRAIFYANKIAYK